jgi:hypothetical protein
MAGSRRNSAAVSGKTFFSPKNAPSQHRIYIVNQELGKIWSIPSTAEFSGRKPRLAADWQPNSAAACLLVYFAS